MNFFISLIMYDIFFFKKEKKYTLYKYMRFYEILVYLIM